MRYIQLVLLAVLAVTGLLPADDMGVAFIALAAADITVTTSASGLETLWRKVQTVLHAATNFMFPEWDMLKKFTNFNVDWSFREITGPMDLNEEAGIAIIVEGGWEARPSSVKPVDATWTWVHMEGRFTVSNISKLIQKANPKAMIANQIVYQGKKKKQALSRFISNEFWGYSTGVRCKIDTIDAGDTTATQTVTVKDAYGEAGLGSSGGSTYVSTLLAVNDWIAALRAGALVDTTDSFGKITAKDAATKQYTITFNGAITLLAGDALVLANNMENTTLAGGTHYNLSMTGMLEGFKSASLHGITHDNWVAGYSDSVATRFTSIYFRRMKQGIENKGGGTMNKVRMSQGVMNDLAAQLQAGVQFPGMNALEVDGDPKAKGVDMKDERTVPPGKVFGWDSSAIQKMVLLPEPGEPTWASGEKMQNQQIWAFPMDYPGNVVFMNRGNLAISENKTEQ